MSASLHLNLTILIIYSKSAGNSTVAQVNEIRNEKTKSVHPTCADNLYQSAQPPLVGLPSAVDLGLGA